MAWTYAPHKFRLYDHLPTASCYCVVLATHPRDHHLGQTVGFPPLATDILEWTIDSTNKKRPMIATGGANEVIIMLPPE